MFLKNIKSFLDKNINIIKEYTKLNNIPLQNINIHSLLGKGIIIVIIHVTPPAKKIGTVLVFKIFADLMCKRRGQ